MKKFTKCHCPAKERRGCEPRSSGRSNLINVVAALSILISACAPATQTLTPVIAVKNNQQVEVWAEPTVATPPPLRFDLPTPGAEPVSGWRPPLYPVPWAVSPFDHFYFARPIGADNVNWPLAQYRYGGIFFDSIVHTGVDIPDQKGTSILAAGPGTVVWAGWGLFTESPMNLNDPYGQAVAIRHDFGYQGQQLYTVYAHMEAIAVSPGQWVDTGEVIGYVGDTGLTTGPHLHFEVRLGENTFHHTYNPELWMSPPQGWGVLVGRLLDDKDRPLEWQNVEVRPEPEGRPLRTVRTYGGGAANPDPYYDENLVLSDLPAGIYKISLVYGDDRMQFWAEIYPGQVTYFTFRPDDGFALSAIPTPKLKFLPPTPTIAVTPEATP